MSRPTLTLLVILLVQGAVTATLYWPDSMFTQLRKQAPLASFNPDFMDEIHVSDANNNEAIVVKVDGRWLVPELEGLPADTQMINTMLAALTAEPHGRPVADTIPARQPKTAGVAPVSGRSLINSATWYGCGKQTLWRWMSSELKNGFASRHARRRSSGHSGLQNRGWECHQPIMSSF